MEFSSSESGVARFLGAIALGLSVVCVFLGAGFEALEAFGAAAEAAFLGAALGLAF